MKLTQHLEEVKLELQIAPLIDVVFLLLIYFMVTASLIKKEGDISLGGVNVGRGFSWERYREGGIMEGGRGRERCFMGWVGGGRFPGREGVLIGGREREREKEI